MKTKTFEEFLNENGSLFYKSVGVSMLPLIREGRDFVNIVKYCGQCLCKYDVVFYRRPGVSGRGEYVLHRILKVNNDGTYWIVGDNCTEGETVMGKNILGVLVSVKRNGKLVEVIDMRYRIYVYLWCAPYNIRFVILRCIRLLRRIVRRISGTMSAWN